MVDTMEEEVAVEISFRCGGGRSSGGWGGRVGGGSWYKWACCGGKGKGRARRSMNNPQKFAQCMGRGRCRGMRLDCPLHCGGPFFYDCHSATICARLVISYFSS
eukprot:XP_024450357.1 uncharacterized protein LOC112326505 [Populus trichocarpa]